MMKRIALALAIALPLFAASPDSEKRALIHELMGVIGAEHLLRDALERVFLSGDQENPQFAEERAKAKNEIESTLQRIDFTKHADDVFFPIFARLTVAELKDAIAFYKTPSGQKVVRLLPALSDVGINAIRIIGPELQKVEAERIAEERNKQAPWKRAMADLRMLAVASEAYATDENHYPKASSVEELSKILSPTYIRETPLKDPWGHEYVYIVSPDLEHYRFASAGSDGSFDYDSKVLAIDTAVLQPQRRDTTDPKEDLIYQDGEFVRAPKAAKQEPQP
jgi:hypothetical protein